MATNKNGRLIKADYFQLSEEKGDFNRLLKDLMKKDISERMIPLADRPVRLETCSVWKDGEKELIEGELVRIRMENLPVKASENAGIDDLGLKADEGIGEETAFLYSPADKVLILQRNRQGVSYTRFEDYFNHMDEDNTMIALFPMMTRAALERMKNAAGFRALTITVAPVSGTDDLKDCGASVSHAMDAMDALGGERISFTVSLKHRQGNTLDRRSIMDTVKNLLHRRERGSDIATLQLRADEEDDGVNVIDFIKDRLCAREMISYDTDRRMSYNVRQQFLRRAWTWKAFQKMIAK